jgi:hypothetical protein
MTQVTPQEVKDLIGLVDADNEVDLTEHVNTAGIIVEEDLAASGQSTQRKKLVELYLAAHFATLAIERGSLRAEEVGESREEYRDIDGEGLNSTRWGQQAVALDDSGTLSDIANPNLKAEFEVVGTP